MRAGVFSCPKKPPKTSILDTIDGSSVHYCLLYTKIGDNRMAQKGGPLLPPLSAQAKIFHVVASPSARISIQIRYQMQRSHIPRISSNRTEDRANTAASSQETMVHLPSPDGIASALSLILATLASLRAASRLEQRICNNGSIGLMDGPPILGPAISNRTSSTLKNGKGSSSNGDGKGKGQVINVSPLWEHTEAFRYAAILGLIFDDSSLLDDYDDATKSPIFSSIIRNDALRDGSSNDIDSSFAASIESGLCRNARGGGVAANTYPQTTKRKDDDPQSRNAVIAISNWFVRELSAPFAAIPAWRRLLRSLHERKEKQNTRINRWSSLIIEWPRFLLTGKSDNDRFYDSSKLDFDATISGVVRIPCVVDHPTKKKAQCLSSKSVRVKSFAPSTFRDLRNKCFGVSEKEYAKSILNIVENGVSMDSEFGEQLCHSDDDDVSVANSIETIIHRRRLFRRSSPKTLPYISFQSNSKGAARSGTFFFFTSDGAYMVKTVKKEEAKAFVEMLPKYHRFMSKSVNSRNSLLTRFCGMYSVQPLSTNNKHSSMTVNEEKWDGGLFSSTRELSTDIADDERVYVVMNSVFPPQASSFITRRFDLKGSTVGRECSAEEIQTKGANAVLKDLNLKREVQLELQERASDQGKKKQPRYGIHIGSRKKAALLAQLERDVTLLQECGVLDYSLLVGVADTTSPRSRSGGANDATPRALQNFFRWMDAPMPYYGAGSTKVDGGNLSSIRGTLMGKDVIYYMGVIDFLQPWTIKKRLERDLKGLVGYDKTAISCVAPSDYSTRFLSFIDSHVT